MSQYHDHLYQLANIQDYKDQMTSALFQMFKILTEHFPSADTTFINKINLILDDDYKKVIDQIKDEEYRVYNF